MKLSFRAVALGVAGLCVALTAIWALAPDLFLERWGVLTTPSAAFVGRRAATLYFGYSVLLFLARDLEPSPARSAIAYGNASWFAALATLGAGEFLVGDAGPGIFLAVSVEALLAVVFFGFGRSRAR